MDAMSHDKQAYFGSLYGSNDDPYGVRARWYEQRKRALLMAALPAPRYARAYEPGCGVAELTVGLAGRCDAVLAADFSPDAVRIARDRTAGLGNVVVEQHRLPDHWPREACAFDLIVLSEVLYFVAPAAMPALLQACRASLRPGGTVVACDWKPDFDERAQSTADVHAALDSLGLARIATHDEADFSLKVWCDDSRSVAEREGIR